MYCTVQYSFDIANSGVKFSYNFHNKRGWLSKKTRHDTHAAKECACVSSQSITVRPPAISVRGSVEIPPPRPSHSPLYDYIVPIHLTLTADLLTWSKRGKTTSNILVNRPQTPFASLGRGGEWRRCLQNMMGRLSKTDPSAVCVVREACFRPSVCALL